MKLHSPTRRQFLESTAATTSLAAIAWPGSQTIAEPRAANERLRVGLIGCGWLPDIKRQGRGMALGRQVTPLADLVAICDVDRIALDFGNQRLTSGKAALHEDYRDMLEQEDLDAVIIASPDHWHAKMSIDAMRAGLDVYCEKPATLTIAEGRQMAEVARETKRILQVGTQQRTENNQRFAKAVAMVRAGRIGRLQQIHIGLDAGNVGGPFETSAPPKHFNWDLWLGPAPECDYLRERTHWTFRWWFEYAGGKLTDWGAHHVDIAHWAMNLPDGTGPTRIAGNGEFQMPYKDGYAVRDDMYNTPSTFAVRCDFPDDVQMTLDSGRNGITFTGSEGRFFVNRNTLEGKPVDDLKNNPLPADSLEQLYGGQPPKSHMQNFLDCVRTRRQPVSDIGSHHAAITTCHLANLALRLQRPLQWNAAEERFVDDAQADTFLARPARAGYEIEA